MSLIQLFSAYSETASQNSHEANAAFLTSASPQLYYLLAAVEDTSNAIGWFSHISLNGV